MGTAISRIVLFILAGVICILGLAILAPSILPPSLVAPDTPAGIVDGLRKRLNELAAKEVADDEQLMITVNNLTASLASTQAALHRAETRLHKAEVRSAERREKSRKQQEQ